MNSLVKLNQGLIGIGPLCFQMSYRLHLHYDACSLSPLSNVGKHKYASVPLCHPAFFQLPPVRILPMKSILMMIFVKFIFSSLAGHKIEAYWKQRIDSIKSILCLKFNS